MFTAANRYLWLILLIGLALGVANYALGVWDALGRSILLQVIISLAIGYPSIVLTMGGRNFFPSIHLYWQRLLVVGGILFLIGCLATEIQALADFLLFGIEEYSPLSSGGIYLFNGILSLILGLAMFQGFTDTPEATSTEEDADVSFNKIPLKQGEGTVLFPVKDILYFEAYDNYSFLYDLQGKKHLCNYSLAYLEERLTGKLLRVHRKYLVNPDRISKITPHLKGRFLIEFPGLDQHINSSASYGGVVKGLLKL